MTDLTRVFIEAQTKAADALGLVLAARVRALCTSAIDELTNTLLPAAKEDAVRDRHHH